VVDNVSRPNMYIIFHDAQAYPEYMILFKWFLFAWYVSAHHAP
jgi:hypothetical protein